MLYRIAKKDRADNAPASVANYYAEGDVAGSTHDGFDAEDPDILEQNGGFSNGEGGLIHWYTGVKRLGGSKGFSIYSCRGTVVRPTLRTCTYCAFVSVSLCFPRP